MGKSISWQVNHTCKACCKKSVSFLGKRSSEDRFCVCVYTCVYCRIDRGDGFDLDIKGS